MRRRLQHPRTDGLDHFHSTSRVDGQGLRAMVMNRIAW
jgi:hypothetical protein